MWPAVRSALSLLGLFTLLCGGLYPLGVSGFAALAFPRAATGSIMEVAGQEVGSMLVGQPFARPEFFFGRPSATRPVPYDARAGAGSNLGPANPALRSVVAARVRTLREADPTNARPIPLDLVTASASGLDPHISRAAADYQVARVARLRGLSETRVRRLVDAHVERGLAALTGPPRVNVLRLNLALQALQPRDARGGAPLRDR